MEIKTKLAIPPILRLPNLYCPFVLYTDVPDYDVEAVLMQEHNAILHPAAKTQVTSYFPRRSAMPQ